MLLTETRNRGGVCMEVVISFLVAVLSDVACHYIIIWLDSDDKSNNSGKR